MKIFFFFGLIVFFCLFFFHKILDFYGDYFQFCSFTVAIGQRQNLCQHLEFC